ncbi:MAG: chemotaxis protein CheW [Nitrospirales bacterium]|nr:purine-binding chemotaxis protein CheW [Nitrospira sp.]MDR4461960.1 chemotaxis protein CheW [Nitrospirales bacterium]
MQNSLTKVLSQDDFEEDSGAVLQMVSFQLGDEVFAIDILEVQEIIRMLEITQVPNAPHYVEGVVNLRGKVIPIINLRARFGLSGTEPTKDTRIVVVEVAQMILGFIVDSVEEVLRLSEECIETPPPTVRGGAEECHKGVGRVNGCLVLLLDLERLFSHQAY